MKNILAENMLRFGSKNLSEEEKQNLQRLTEQFGEYNQFIMKLNGLGFKKITPNWKLPYDLTSTTPEGLDDFYKSNSENPIYTVYIILQGPKRQLKSNQNSAAANWRSIVRLYTNDKFTAGNDSIAPFTSDNGKIWSPDYNAIWTELLSLLRKYSAAAKALKIKA